MYGARNLCGRYAIDGSVTGKEKHVTQYAEIVIVWLKNGMIIFLHWTLDSGYEMIVSDKNAVHNLGLSKKDFFDNVKINGFSVQC